MTDRLYDKDAYLTEFEAEVISCLPASYNKAQGFEAVLSSTSFFPEQGGQDSDTGFLMMGDFRINVSHVSIRDGEIYHFIDQQIEPGTLVAGSIDWPERYDKMQQHSGEHLVSGFVHKKWGYDNVGFHLGAEDVTIDFNGCFEDGDYQLIEEQVNSAVYSDIETHIFFPDKAELDKLPYRSKKEIDGQVRLVEFPGWDLCACCAPHIKRTGEIGMIKIMSVEHFRGGTRMTIKCGRRALKEFDRMLDTGLTISRLLSVPVTEIGKASQSQFALNSDLKFRVNMLERRIFQKMAEDALAAGNTEIITDIVNNDAAREAVNYMAERSEGYCSCYMGSEEKGWRFIIGSQKLDCRSLITQIKNSGAKGGGSATMIQGTASAPLHLS